MNFVFHGIKIFIGKYNLYKSIGFNIDDIYNDLNQLNESEYSKSNKN